MEIKNIIEICVGLDIALIALAYPIIRDQYYQIGEKYSSETLIKLFDREYPQTKLWKGCATSWLEASIYLVLFSFCFLIFNFEPLFGWNNKFINNSANIFVFSCTLWLAFNIIRWLNNFRNYRGDLSNIISNISDRLKNENDDLRASELNDTLIEIAVYCIRNDKPIIASELAKHYDNTHIEVRQSSGERPFTYNDSSYQLWVSVCEELTKQDFYKPNKLIKLILRGYYFFGRDQTYKTISDDTYRVLWHCILQISNDAKLVAEYWEGAYAFAEQNQYFSPSDEDETIAKEKFNEFHLALGGLLVHQKQFKSISYIFSYSTSIPAHYHILPVNMTKLFKQLSDVYSDRNTNQRPWDLSYPFPEVRHLGEIGKIPKAIAVYSALLFIRQFMLPEFRTYHDHTGQPTIPDNRQGLYHWKEFIDWFEKIFRVVKQNYTLLEEVGLAKVVDSKGDKISRFISILKQTISERITHAETTATLQPSCVEAFKSNSEKIIKNTFNKYVNVFDIQEKEDPDDFVQSVRGPLIELDRFLFTDNCSDADAHSYWGREIANDLIKREIPVAFMLFRTKSYTIVEEDIIASIIKLLEKTNVNDRMVVGIELRGRTKEKLGLSDENKIIYDTTEITEIPATNHIAANKLYVMRQIDKPSLRFLNEDLLKDSNKNLPSATNETVQLHIDLFEKTNNEGWVSLEVLQNLPNDKVLGALLFNTLISARKSREIIEINIQSPFDEPGIVNSLQDIVPMEP